MTLHLREVATQTATRSAASLRRLSVMKPRWTSSLLPFRVALEPRSRKPLASERSAGSAHLSVALAYRPRNYDFAGRGVRRAGTPLNPVATATYSRDRAQRLAFRRPKLERVPRPRGWRAGPRSRAPSRHPRVSRPFRCEGSGSPGSARGRHRRVAHGPDQAARPDGGHTAPSAGNQAAHGGAALLRRAVADVGAHTRDVPQTVRYE